MKNKKERQAEKSDALLLYKDIQRIPAYAFYKKSPRTGSAFEVGKTEKNRFFMAAQLSELSVARIVQFVEEAKQGFHTACQPLDQQNCELFQQLQKELV